MQKIGMLAGFAEMKETDNATFVHPQEHIGTAREIKMRILAEQATCLYVIPVKWDYEKNKVVEVYDDPDFIRFLAYVEPGMDRLEFNWDGSFSIRVKGGSIWLDTFDNSSAFSIESLEPESFARVWEREERDERILEIERAARHNENRLREQMAQDRAEFQMMIAEARNVAAKIARTAEPSSSPSDEARQVSPGAPASDSSGNAPVESGTGGVS